MLVSRVLRRRLIRSEPQARRTVAAILREAARQRLAAPCDLGVALIAGVAQRSCLHSLQLPSGIWRMPFAHNDVSAAKPP